MERSSRPNDNCERNRKLIEKSFQSQSAGALSIFGFTSITATCWVRWSWRYFTFLTVNPSLCKWDVTKDCFCVIQLELLRRRRRTLPADMWKRAKYKHSIWHSQTFVSRLRSSLDLDSTRGSACKHLKHFGYDDSSYKERAQNDVMVRGLSW